VIQPHECHRLQGKPILGVDGEDACPCFLTGGGWLDCPKAMLVEKAYATVAKAALTGDICSTCGGTNMRRAGTCLLCSDCGSTSGGCS
jgi:hypothetical protein